MKKRKLAVIGCRGHWGYVTREIANFPDLDWCAVSTGCADAPDRMVAAAAEKGFSPRIYSDYRELLATESPELVVVDGPFELHTAITLDALAAGAHVLCEKPVALTWKQLDQLRTACRDLPEHRILLPMQELRCVPAMRAARRAVAAGAVGTVRLISARKSYRLGQRPGFYRDRSTYGGTIPWVGSHALDWIMWFGGAPFEYIDALHDRSDNAGLGDLETSAALICRLTNGVLATAHLDYFRPSAAPTHDDDRVRVAGSRGVIEVTAGKVQLLDETGEHEVPPEPGDGIFGSFVRAAAGETAPPVSRNELLELNRALLAARDAADRHC